MTPVHDHLAWGLVGLYRGNQDEEFYEPRPRSAPTRAPATAAARRLLPRCFPPRDDVHRVRTTSDVTSVSIHLLANDTGCVLRHTFDQDTGEAEPFRSGYVNAECDDAAACGACSARGTPTVLIDNDRVGDSLARRARGGNGLAQTRARLCQSSR